MTAPGERVVYGAGPVRELLARRPQAIKVIWVDPARAGRAAHDPVSAIVNAARTAGVRVEDKDRATLDRAAAFDSTGGSGRPRHAPPDDKPERGPRPEARHQGVVAWLGAFAYAALDELVPAQGQRPLLVALDGVEDPRNLGAILRSAYLLGVDGVIIPEHRAAQVTAVVAKASAGASELVPIAQVGNLVRALDELRERGLWRVAVHATETAQPIATIDGTLALCLVLGAEGGGVRPLVAKNCDFHAIIPMAAERGAIGSFNVSVAAALALYEVQRQRLASPPRP